MFNIAHSASALQARGAAAGAAQELRALEAEEAALVAEEEADERLTQERKQKAAAEMEANKAEARSPLPRSLPPSCTHTHAGERSARTLYSTFTRPLLVLDFFVLDLYLSALRRAAPPLTPPSSIFAATAAATVSCRLPAACSVTQAASIRKTLCGENTTQSALECALVQPKNWLYQGSHT